MKGILSELSSSAVAMKASGSTSSNFAKYFLNLIKVELVLCGFAVLPGRADASAHLKAVLRKHDASSNFPTESLQELFQFV